MGDTTGMKTYRCEDDLQHAKIGTPDALGSGEAIQKYLGGNIDKENINIEWIVKLPNAASGTWLQVGIDGETKISDYNHPSTPFTEGNLTVDFDLRNLNGSFTISSKRLRLFGDWDLGKACGQEKCSVQVGKPAEDDDPLETSGTQLLEFGVD